MKKPESHNIDDQAKAVFQKALSEWVVQELTRDYGIDFRVVVVKDGVTTEAVFLAQLKGTRVPKVVHKYGDKCISYPFPVANLIDYVDKNREPIFLVVVDVTNGIGYWLFVQGYAAEHLNYPDWRRQEKKAIYVPRKNLITEKAAFLQAAENAIEFMANRYPGSVPAAISAEQRKLEALDPRFGVSLTASDNHLHYDARAKENVNLQLIIPEDVDKLRKKEIIGCLERGLPLAFSPGEILFEGSSLFDEALKRGGTIQASTCVEAQASWIVRDSTEQELCRIDGIAGKLSGGRSEMRFEGQLPSGLLKLEMTLSLPGEGDMTKVPAPLSLHWAAWKGLPILSLPYFEQLRTLFDPQGSGRKLRLELHLPAHQVLGGTSSPLTSSASDPKWLFLSSLHKARSLARQFGVNPVFPDSFGPKEIDAINRLYSLATGETVIRNGKRATISVDIAPYADNSALLNTSKTGPLTITSDLRESLLGADVEMGSYSLTLTHAKRITSDAVIREHAATKGSGSLRLEFKGTEKSEIIEEKAEEIRGTAGS